MSVAQQRELEHYYSEIAMEMGEEAHQDFDLAGIPKFIDEVTIGDEIWYSLIFIISAYEGYLHIRYWPYKSLRYGMIHRKRKP